ncbi:hypothetical protein Goshw_019981, partial [Gossypium schwendimanii]|nr:hypothetical protein [Gossypium schwendimanii]
DLLKLHEGRANWVCLFGLLAWCIWKNYNLFVNQDITWSSNEIIKESNRNWVHINIDGVVQLDLGLVVAGGVVCDENRDWVFGYNRYLGKCSIFYVELWGILDGLKLIQRRGHDKVIIQSHGLE